jgi:alpha-D-ribose 1-methylphosphonate 5-triphosphate synthase subunit PhnG
MKRRKGRAVLLVAWVAALTVAVVASSAWAVAAKITELRKGVAGARIGIRMLRGAMEAVGESFGAWEARECQAAVKAIDAGAARFPAGVEQVNRGMQRLWELAFSDTTRP